MTRLKQAWLALCVVATVAACQSAPEQECRWESKRIGGDVVALSQVCEPPKRPKGKR